MARQKVGVIYVKVQVNIQSPIPTCLEQLIFLFGGMDSINTANAHNITITMCGNTEITLLCIVTMVISYFISGYTLIIIRLPLYVNTCSSSPCMLTHAVAPPCTLTHAVAPLVC